MIAEDTLLAEQLPDDLIRYRNYLRDIFAGLHNPYVWSTLLELRFHQNFLTSDTRLRPADDLINDVLTEILVAPSGPSYGFAVPASTITARGARSSREYQGYLIELTGESADELSRRYRLDLPRPSDARSSPVIENIITLLGFFRDSFQCGPEPFPILPRPPAGLTHWTAPFFLEYGEWLRKQGPFYAENWYQVMPAYSLGWPPGYRYPLGSAGDYSSDLMGEGGGDLNKLLTDGRNAFLRGRYADAQASYRQAETFLTRAFASPLFFAATRQPDATGNPTWQFAPEALEDLVSRQSWKKLRDQEDLARFNRWFDAAYPGEAAPNRRTQIGLIHLAAVALPVALGDVALASGDYAGAARHYLRTFARDHLLGLARLSDTAGFWGTIFPADADVPYTWDTHGRQGGLSDLGVYPFRPDLLVRYGLLHPMERRFLHLRLGNALLEWADALYRTDDPASLARARELYKAVGWLQGVPPPTCPRWKALEPIERGDPTVTVEFVNARQNPAQVSQKTRASLGFAQLEAGLNYFGFRADVVPTLRYRPLKDSADRLAALAKSAQTDFLLFMDKIEELAKESIQLANMLKKASLLAEVADKQIALAEDGVAQAEAHKQRVLDAIDAKAAEIAKKSDFLEQLGDYLGGVLDIVNKVRTAGIKEKTIGDESKGEKKELVGIDLIGITTLEGGGAIMTGFGAFWGASYLTLDSMADAANQRHADLQTLIDNALPAAEVQIATRRVSVTIARLQQQIAMNDADLAHSLMAFQERRFLNVDFWAALATVLKRILRRYLELGTRASWLAQRALAYEQDRDIDLLRFDYFPVDRQGLPGADQLQADLAELEASRLDGIKETVPIKHTFSLARDFPLQFGQLKSTGRCDFRTAEQSMRLTYPGVYGYRVLATTVVVQTIEATPAVRGVLTNQGVSLITRADGSEHSSLRPRDALPLSEFRLKDDMAVHGLPNEALMPFEGSGLDTFWSLEFPTLANPYGLGGVADVTITVDLRASYSGNLHATHLASKPKSVARLILISAQKHQPAAMAALRAPTTTGTVVVIIDPSEMGLPKGETARVVTNLVIAFVGKALPAFSAELSMTSPPVTRTIPFSLGIAASNASPTSPPTTPAPLNDFVTAKVDQSFRIAIEASALPAEARASITDIVVGIEYHADIIG